ncbi:hypothetical protein SARC_01284 [Sphaeroforma arctica JP610]|uniref:Heme peroxidase n=1 Tax=Sphaeroforma arctica JP610 TaxID=667725 RepID=A0A0L0GCF2_9EUKA|nr:hypothetical protein SARC_01284 [Sphaeroforma arctica JP610]KNC86561.1 hypothetical protein SARC_01284 [Sphaeroforma arctica JP610]|eukprot:XP_014160463.1 hypothetical protein SARC_01284 [Sphaeroforma arctica JP610]
MEQPGLTALHKLFAWEHNRLAELIHDELYPRFSVDEPDTTDLNRIFDEARLVVEATMRKITYEDWLPALSGRKLKQNDVDYINLNVSPNIMTIFSGAFFRVGHTMVNNEFWRFDTGNGNVNRNGGGGGRQDDDAKVMMDAKAVMVNEDHENVARLNKDLMDHGHRILTVGAVLTTMNIDPILAGLVYQPNQAIDTLVVPALRSHLFEFNLALVDGTHTTAFDLVARNIQRGRDLGIDSYVDVRTGLLGSFVNAVTSWEDITQNGHTIQKLKNLYGETGWGKLDLYVGMLLERHEQGSSLGRTLRAGIELQFSILQQGDCLWYTKTLRTCGAGIPLFDEKLAILTGSRTLAGVLRDNTGLDVAPNYNDFQTRHSQGAQSSLHHKACLPAICMILRNLHSCSCSPTSQLRHCLE